MLEWGHQFSLLLSLVWLFATPWTAACQASLSINNSWSLLKLIVIESMIPSNHLILCCPLLLLPLIFPSIRFFSKESALHIRWPDYWHFCSCISLSIEYSGLITFMIDWFDLLVVQGTLTSFLQHHSLKVSVLCIRWPKYWSFSFSISPSNEYSGQISFRMDWLDLFAVQETLKSLCKHHSSKASILQCSAFFIVQLSHSYVTTWPLEKP